MTRQSFARWTALGCIVGGLVMAAYEPDLEVRAAMAYVLIGFGYGLLANNH